MQGNLSLPYAFEEASITRGRFAFAGSGSGHTRSIAAAKALGEALERFAFRTPASLHRLPAGADTAAWVDPRTIVRYSSRQCRSPRFSLRPFVEPAAHWWVGAEQYCGGSRSAVLAECVYSRRLPFGGSGTYTSVSTSGMATDASVEVAMHRAILELIERDAFMRHWMAQRGGREIARHSLPRALEMRVAILERAGCRISVQRLPTDLAYVALVIVQHRQRHFTCLGSAAALYPEKAVDHALREAEIMTYSRLAIPSAPRTHPRRVRTPEDHANLYAQPEFFRKGDRLFLVDGRTELPASPPKLLPKSPDNLVRRLRGRFGRVLCVDMTVPRVHERFGNLRTVRAIVPGLIPLTFGYGHLPLGMVSCYHPGCLFPHPFA